MSCSSPGATHHAACDCREAEWAARLAAAEKAREEAEERLTLKRREYDIEVEVHAATKRERDSYIKGYEAAESRAARLEAALREIESKTGHFGEAPPPPEWMPMLSLIAWVGRTARAALREEGK